MTELGYYLTGIFMVSAAFLVVSGIMALWIKYPKLFSILFIGMWILILGVAAGQALMEAGL